MRNSTYRRKRIQTDWPEMSNTVGLIYMCNPAQTKPGDRLMLTALAIHCEAHQQSRIQIKAFILRSDVTGERRGTEETHRRLKRGFQRDSNQRFAR